MNSKNPLVSIIIPVYNGENYVKEAIESALSQTYKNIEIIVVNDGSKDKTDEICKSFGEKIRYFKKENGGVSTALNLGIKNMKGEYFSWLSHDDLYDINKVEIEIETVNSLVDDDTFVTCNYDYIDKNGNFLYKNSIDKNILKTNKAYIYLFNYLIHGCCVLIPKKWFDRVGLFNVNLPSTQDFDMWFRIFKNKKVCFINKSLVHSRIHEEQDSKKFEDTHVEECSDLWIKFFNNLTMKDIKYLHSSENVFYAKTLETLKKYVSYPKVFKYLENKIIETTSIDKKIKFLKQNFCYNPNIEKKLLDKKKKRIVFGCFGSWDDRGGLNRVVANISNILSSDYEIFIFTTGCIEKGYEVNSNVNILKIKFSSSKNDFYSIVYKTIRYCEIDIYINLYNCLDLYINLCDYLKNFDVKVIAWNHEFYFLPYYNQNFVDCIKNRNEIFSRLDLVLWLTSASARVYNQFGNNSYVMHNALTINSNFKKTTCKDNSIISIARFDDIRKGAEDMVILAKYLKDENLNIKIKLYGNYDLDLIGERTKMPLKELLNKYKLNNNHIEFMGFIKNIEEIYSKSKLNLLLSYHEGFGLTITESATYGIPTIAYNDSGFEDMIIDSKNGYLVNRGDFKSLVEKIKLLYEDDKLYKQAGINAQENAKSFQIDIIANKWRNIIESVIKGEKVKSDLKLNSINYEIAYKNAIFEYEKSIKNLLNNKSVIDSNNQTVNDRSNDNNELLLEQILESKSWKITKPLRWTANKYRKILKR